MMKMVLVACTHNNVQQMSFGLVYLHPVQHEFCFDMRLLLCGHNFFNCSAQGRKELLLLFCCCITEDEMLELDVDFYKSQNNSSKHSLES